MSDEQKPKMDLVKKLKILEGPTYAAHRKDREEGAAYAVHAMEVYYRERLGDELFERDTYLQEGLARAAMGYRTGSKGLSDSGILGTVMSLAKAHSEVLTQEISLKGAYSYLSDCGINVPKDLKSIYERYGDKTFNEVDNKEDKGKIAQSMDAFLSHKFVLRDAQMSKMMTEGRLEDLVKKKDKGKMLSLGHEDEEAREAA